jgi:hypothetical protein
VVHVHPLPTRSLDNVITRVRRGENTLRVTSPEQTLVDLASLPNPRQDYEADLEAFRTLLPRVDPEKLLQVVRSTKRRATLARVGHLIAASGRTTAQLEEVRRSIRNSLEGAGPKYFATRPNDPTNRFDREFKLVYPGGH